MTEEEVILELLHVGETVGELQDDLHVRLANALTDRSASGLDRAVLVRQLLRRWSLRDGRSVPVDLRSELARSIREQGIRGWTAGEFQQTLVR